MQVLTVGMTMLDTMKLLAATGIHYIKLENHKSVGPSF